MIIYNKLWILLNEKGMKRTDLLKEPIKLTSNTLAKMGKNENITTDTIEKICKGLNCQPGDIMEYINEEEAKREFEKIIGKMQGAIKELAIIEGKEIKEYQEQIKAMLPPEYRDLVDKEGINWESFK